VLKIDAPNLIPASFGDSDALRPGDWAIAIGNPLSLQSSVTLGIISSTARENVYIGGKTLERVIQTDAPINPGNSGGALANVNGELIGINTAIVTGGSSGSIGIGFAIPINSARTVAADLIQFRKVRRAWLGVFTDEASRYIEGKRGLIVFNVVSGSPADKAGLNQYDIIVRINDQPIGNAIDFSKAMRNRKIGESISLEVEREGQVVRLRAVLAENPS
jgi:S1-C subfamily serine protease